MCAGNEEEEEEQQEKGERELIGAFMVFRLFFVSQHTCEFVLRIP